jgi:hypothetical protein
VIDFIHLGVLIKSQLGEENVLDFVRYAEVRLQSLQECFARDAALYPKNLERTLAMVAIFAYN